MKIIPFLFVFGAVINISCPVAQAADEDDQQKKEPITYESCVLDASQGNTKWTQYKVDVNNRRNQFGIEGEC